VEIAAAGYGPNDVSELWFGDRLPISPGGMLREPRVACIIEPEEADPISVDWLESKGARLPLPLVRATPVELGLEPVPSGQKSLQVCCLTDRA